MKGDTRCVEGTLWEHRPQDDDPYLEIGRGKCPECDGKGCEAERDEVEVDEVLEKAIDEYNFVSAKADYSEPEKAAARSAVRGLMVRLGLYGQFTKREDKTDQRGQS